MLWIIKMLEQIELNSSANGCQINARFDGNLCHHQEYTMEEIDFETFCQLTVRIET